MSLYKSFVLKKKVQHIKKYLVIYLLSDLKYKSLVKLYMSLLSVLTNLMLPCNTIINVLSFEHVCVHAVTEQI